MCIDIKITKKPKKNSTTSSNRGKNRKKVEFSKKIFILLYIMQISVTLSSFYIMYTTGNADALAQVMISTTSLTTIAVSFYYWKSKAENQIKIRKGMRNVNLDTSYIDNEIEEHLNNTDEDNNVAG